MIKVMPSHFESLKTCLLTLRYCDSPLGWLFKVKLIKPAEIEELMDEKKYEEFLKSDSH